MQVCVIYTLNTTNCSLWSLGFGSLSQEGEERGSCLAGLLFAPVPWLTNPNLLVPRSPEWGGWGPFYGLSLTCPGGLHWEILVPFSGVSGVVATRSSLWLVPRDKSGPEARKNALARGQMYKTKCERSKCLAVVQVCQLGVVRIFTFSCPFLPLLLFLHFRCISQARTSKPGKMRNAR